MSRPLRQICLCLIALIALSACTSEADRLYRRAKDAAQEEGDYELAVEFVEQAILLDPDQGRFERRHGDWLRELGLLEEAIAAYDRAANAADSVDSAIVKAISVCIELGRLDEAEERIAAAEDSLSDPDDLDDLDDLRVEIEALRASAEPVQPTPEPAPDPAPIEVVGPASPEAPVEPAPETASPESASPEQP